MGIQQILAMITVVIGSRKRKIQRHKPRMTGRNTGVGRKYDGEKAESYRIGGEKLV